MIGGCRDDADKLRVQQLQAEAKRMGLSERQVVFEVNVPSSKIKQYLAEATINLHTMVDEHFGISKSVYSLFYGNLSTWTNK